MQHGFEAPIVGRVFALVRELSGRHLGQRHFDTQLIGGWDLLHGMVGGAKHYARQPRPVKEVCRGLRRTLILQRFPTVDRLVEHLDTFRWP